MLFTQNVLFLVQTSPSEPAQKSFSKGDILWDLGATLISFFENFMSDFSYNPENMRFIYTLGNIIFFAFILIFIIFLLRFILWLPKAMINRKKYKNIVQNIKELYKDNTEYDFNAFIKKCEKIGRRIDFHTARPNNSYIVSMLVYEVSKYLEIEEKTCALYFCIGLVYDCGFLDVPEEFMHGEILSARERTVIKTHVMRSDNFLSFVPRSYYELFYNASMFHHENIDGSGYPEGLSGEDIPLVARIIHVVESYVSLTTRRSYHRILNKKNALIELRRRNGIYDSSIITALEKLV